MKLLTCLLLLTAITICQQWYMPDSHLINDKEFVDLVTNDRSCFKFVKYFTPHCPYCRYLKAVFDTLKHQKEWCFSIYELNCQWYPQFCMSNVKSPSFPYTVIYDQNGNLFEEIHGFYPENIISVIFNKIEDECLKLKNPSAGQQSQPVKSQNVQSSLSTQSHVEPIVYQDPANQHRQTAADGQVINSNSDQEQVQTNQPQTQQQSQPQIQSQNQQQQSQPQPTQPQTTQQSISAQPQMPAQQIPKEEQPVRQAQEATTSHQATKSKQQASSVPSYFSYIFYGVCILVAVIYVRSLHHQEQPQHSPGPQQPEATDDRSKGHLKQKQNKVEDVQKDDEDSELLNIPDDQL